MAASIEPSFKAVAKRFGFPPTLLVLMEAVHKRDWDTIQDLSRSKDPTIRTLAFAAADCIQELDDAFRQFGERTISFLHAELVKRQTAKPTPQSPSR
jgi:hypothetical protein